MELANIDEAIFLFILDKVELQSVRLFLDLIIGLL